MKKWLLALVVLAMLIPGSGVALAHGDGGGNFVLGGTARHAGDPTNEDNEVVSIQTGAVPPSLFGFVRRILNVKVPTLDDRLSVNYYFVPLMSCFGGSPRYQLAIDTDGNGVSNGNAFGYLGPSPAFAACPPGVWQFEDLTDNELEWDLTQFGGPFYNTWDQVELFFATFPNHNVLRGSLVADSFTPGPPMSGCSFYDNIEIGNATWRSSANTQTVQGDQPNTCVVDDGDDNGDDDDDDDGDHDHDDDEDEDDEKFDRDRRERWGDDD